MLSVIGEMKAWLEAETAKLRAAVDDADRWLARWELDATFFDEIDRAAALHDAAVESWRVHCDLCDEFAAWSRGVLALAAAEVSSFEGLRR